MDFSILWSSYPRRVGRQKAERIWNKLNEYEQARVLASLALWKQTEQWHQEGGKYIPYASTFLTQKRYLDEPWIGAFGG